MSSVHDIGVAISTRDRPRMLGRCLESLRAGRARFREIVVADQSPDSTTRQVVAAVDSPEFPVRCVDGGSGGLAEAQNSAFHHLDTAIVAVLDDDCVADPGWLATLQQTFDADPELALIGGRVIPLGASTRGRVPVSSRTSSVRRQFVGKSPPWHLGSGNNFAVRREWFDRIGGCDERLGPGTLGQGAVDMDLFYRLLRAGARGLYEPDALVYHERAASEARIARRWPYGHGVGVMCTLRVREGDAYGLRLLADWIGLRAKVLAGALTRKRWAAPREEALMLAGTAAGVAHALRNRLDRSDGERRTNDRDARNGQA